MKSCVASRVLGIVGLPCALLCALIVPTSFGQGWDPGVPGRLFKDGQTTDKTPKPTHRLAPAPEDCPQCQQFVDQLQAALDNWYAMEYAEGEKTKKEAGYGDDSASNEKREKAAALMADAMAGLGQPAPKDLKAKQEQQKKDAKEKKDTHGDKKALAKEIEKLKDQLDDCLAKCKEKKPGEKEQPVKPKVEEKPGGGSERPPDDGKQPGGGEKKGGGGQPPAPNITIPKIPECFKTKKEKDEFIEKLDKEKTKQNADLSNRIKNQADTPENQAGIAQDRANIEALQKAIDEADNVQVTTPCPPKKTGAMLPGFPKHQGENVSLPGGGVPTCTQLVSDGKIKIDNEGTGETIGHVADLIIENLTDEPIECVVPPMLLESGSGKHQIYGCLESHKVQIAAHDKVTVPINGVCIARNRPPVGKGVTGDLMVNEGNPAIAQNSNLHVSTTDAAQVLRLCGSKYKAARKLQDDGAFKDFPYHDKQKQLDIVVQWLVWSDPRICAVSGAPPAKKEDFKKVIYKQVEEHGPMTDETKKKIDKGADTMWDGIELASAKAKDLEPEETPPAGENIEEETPGIPPSENIGQTQFGHTQAKKPTPTPTPKKPSGGKTTSKDKDTPTPKPVEPPKKEELTGGTTETTPQDQDKPEITDATAMPNYPFTKTIDCGTITISIGEEGELVFDFKPNKNAKCPCKKFGWIQHISPADGDNWRYDNGVLPGVTTAKKIGAKSHPSDAKQPTTPPKGTKLKDWDKNPWYGGTTDKKKPKDFGEHPEPQEHISDKPDTPNVKFVTQIVCVETGEVLFTWIWGPFKTGAEKPNQVPGESGSPP